MSRPRRTPAPSPIATAASTEAGFERLPTHRSMRRRRRPAAPARERGEVGFTQVEVVVATAVLAVLGTFAIPGVVDQRIAAYDAAAKIDLRHEAVRVAEIALGDGSATVADVLPVASQRSAGVVVEVEAFRPGVGYCLSARHESSPHVWHWNSRDAVVLAGAGSCPWDATAGDAGAGGGPAADGPGGTTGSSDARAEGPGCHNGVNARPCDPFPGKGRAD